MHIINFDHFASASEHDGHITGLKWRDGRYIQISGSEGADGFDKHLQIRIWDDRAVFEEGDANKHTREAMSIHLVPEGHSWKLESIDYRQPYKLTPMCKHGQNRYCAECIKDGHEKPLLINQSDES